jgi:hypothetical protein
MPKQKGVRRLPKIDLSHIYEIMKPIVWRKREGLNNRCGFPAYRGAIFGMVRPRKNSGQMCLSLDSKRHPDIYHELMHLGNAIVPFEFNSIQVNRNLQCPPHKDKHNVGDSLLISFGDYSGGEIMVDGHKYDAYHKPVIFNGSELEHWNLPIEGDKFSLVFFKMV